MVGPTVAGPTIPVRPAGSRFVEQHTELEDPASVPHPGSMEIHAYRAERQHLREHLVRRIRNIRVPVDPDRQAKGGDVAEGLSNIPEADIERDTVARAALIENWRTALHRSDRPTHAHGPRPPSTPTGGSHHTDQAAKLPSLPDEPPF